MKGWSLMASQTYYTHLRSRQTYLLSSGHDKSTYCPQVTTNLPTILSLEITTDLPAVLSPQVTARQPIVRSAKVVTKLHEATLDLRDLLNSLQSSMSDR